MRKLQRCAAILIAFVCVVGITHLRIDPAFILSDSEMFPTAVAVRSRTLTQFNSTFVKDFLEQISSRPPVTNISSCGCPQSCNFWSLRERRDDPGIFICEERIDYLVNRYKTDRLEACQSAVDDKHCSDSCNPRVCAPFTSLSQKFPPKPSARKPFISYRLDHDRKYTLPTDSIICPDDRPPLPSTLSAKGQLDFTSFVSTNLKILVMGDSVGVHQIGQNFLEATTNGKMTNLTYFKQPATQPYPNNHVAAVDTDGGGVAMVYRANDGLLSEALLQNGPMGVSSHHVWKMREMLYRKTGSSDVDAMVLVPPGGWIGMEENIRKAITLQTLSESIRVAGEIFGAKTVILTPPLISNNLVKLVENALPIRKTVLNMVEIYRHETFTEKLGGVENVLFLDLTKYSIQLVHAQAASMGIVNRSHYTEFPDTETSAIPVLDEALQKKLPSEKVQLPIPLICSELVDSGAGDCPRNAILVDGMHWCMKNSIGGRIHAGRYHWSKQTSQL